MKERHSVFSDKSKFEELAKSSSSIKEFVEAFGINSNGSGGYGTAHKWSEIHGIPLPRVSPQDMVKKAHLAIAVPEEEIFIKDAKCSRKVVKSRLKTLWPVWECSECGLGEEWNGRSLTLQLDHINGVNNDNRLENLRLLCPNCHTQTDTYGNKTPENPKKDLCECGKLKRINSNWCRSCAPSKTGRPTKIEWPDKYVLQVLVQEVGLVRAGKALGVSETSVRKHLKK